MLNSRLAIIKELSFNYWECLCECGQTKIVRKDHFKSGAIRSCGCLLIELRYKHGLSSHALFRVWDKMLQRCYNPKHTNFHLYGGRGIDVWIVWRDNFIPFFSWCMENNWKKGTEIDRIDNDKGYYPKNCRIVTRQQNCQNTRSRGGTSKYKGVIKYKGKYRGQIKHNGKLYVKSGLTEIAAAQWYDVKAEELFGEYAWLNRDHFTLIAKDENEAEERKDWADA